MPRKQLLRPVSENTSATAHVGQSVAVELRGGGGSGFAWQPVSPLPKGVSLKKEYKIPSSRASIGGAGREILNFSFEKKGHYQVDLEFVSPGGHEVVETKKLNFDID
ncbi:protease inhibitor I42 family protein [Methylobacterium tarhaniae]|uniref:protease inhibitor I42 family protein n=1 Tax=Methylobacterium tarhaniae TaxID=1187852 RepID=UPI00142D2FD2|nr:protease inhibitor I42 family protein [Methylobacterium tarhaniae]